MRRWVPVFATLALLSSCARQYVIDDGTSVARGTGNRGWLVNPVELPDQGDGYRIPPRWAYRGNNFGTDEMVRLVVYTGQVLSEYDPSTLLGVADISPLTGGKTIWHRSHQTGLDVDLLFFATDSRDRPVKLSSMPRFGPDGTAWLEGAPRGRRIKFDVARNWQLVRTLLENPIIDIQYIFVSDPLRQLLLDHAIAIDEPWATVVHAGYVLRQPSNSSPHDDHLHVRVFCPRSDTFFGCRDYGDLRWTRRSERYLAQSRRQATWLASLRFRKWPVMLSLSALPFHHPIAN